MKNPELEPFMDLLQEMVAKEDMRRFGEPNILVKCLIFTEEVGELYKAIRIWLKMKTHAKTNRHNLEDEFGDVFYLLIMFANICNVNLVKALLNKMEKDKEKVYEVR